MLTIGRVKGHRGTQGEMTVRIHDGAADEWAGLERVWLAAGDAAPRPFPVAALRTYRDRLVLHLEGIDDGDAAARWRGARVLVPLAEAPPTDENTWYAAELEGLAVRDEAGRTLGTVRAVVATGGVDLLAVTPSGTDGAAAAPDDEFLIPLARSIVLAVDPAAGHLVVRLPAGLLELNREPQDDGR